MTEFKPIAVKIEGLEDMRRLSAALEQYNASSRGDATQINRIEAHLTDARGKLAVLERATVRAVAILNGDPCRPPLPGEPLSVIEEAALSAKGAARRADEIGRVQRDLSEARAELDRARVVAAADLETLRSRDNQIDQMAADIAKLTSRASIAEAANREKDKALAEAHDRIHQLEQTHDQQVGALTAARNNVDAFQRDLARTQGDTSQAIQMLQGKRSAVLDVREVNSPLLREVSAVVRALESNSVTIRNLQEKLADALKMRLTEANDTIANQANVIKELHAQYHELEARKQGVQYDLDRAKEEIEFAEAEIAKYKPLVEAVRGGIAYCYWGKWVPINSVTVADMNDGTAVSLFIPNSEGPKCL